MFDELDDFFNLDEVVGVSCNCDVWMLVVSVVFWDFFGVWVKVGYWYDYFDWGCDFVVVDIVDKCDVVIY